MLLQSSPPQPWLFEVPQSALTKTVREQWQDYLDDCAQEIGLVTAGVAGRLLGVSRSRIYQLFEAGKFTRFEHFGHSWISCAEIMDRLKAPVDLGGRPRL